MFNNISMEKREKLEEEGEKKVERLFARVNILKGMIRLRLKNPFVEITLFA